MKLINKKTFLLFSFIFLNIFFLKAQTEIIFQAENADTIFHGRLDNSHNGYTGIGFTDLDNEEGSYLVWNIDIPQDAEFKLTVRFANGGVDRTMHIIMNDILIKENYNFPSTVEWTTWDTTSFNIDIASGINSFKMVGSNPNSGPNIDCIMLYNPDLDLVFKPVAKNDSIRISINQVILIDVLNNDYDYDDELTITGFSQPQNGTVEKLSQQEMLKYKPDPGFIGQDEFTYTITDGVDVDSAKVVVNIHDWLVELESLSGRVYRVGPG